MSRKKSTFALFVGLAAGVATGVLLSPTSGKEFRSKLKKQIKDGKFSRESLFKQFKTLAKDVKQTAKKNLDPKELKKNTKKAVSKAKTVVTKKATAAKKAVNKTKTAKK